MKKMIVWALVLLLCGAMFAGAEDAKVMPKRVGRLYLAPTYAFANHYFDADGDRKEYPSGAGSMKAFNLVMALEYGVIDWITGALQWKPGVNLWSDVDMKVPYTTSTGTTAYSDSSINTHGVSDLFLGAKMQIIGEKALVPIDSLRLCIAPGVKIPLPGPDYEKQLENAAKGESVTAANLDYHSLGLGARFYFDYIVNDKFFVNLYSEFVGYPVKGKASRSGYGEYFAINSIKKINSTSTHGDLIDYNDKVGYGFDLTFEMEPVFSTPLGKSAIIFTAGLPFNYKLTPGKKYGDVSLTAAGTAAYGTDATFAGGYNTIKGTLTDKDPTHLLTMTPNISFFFTKWFLPTDFKLQYSIPLAGKNERATNALTLIAKLYVKI